MTTPTSSNDASQVARLLREARQSAGLSQREIGRRTGLDQAVISKYEQGVREPSASRLLRLLRAANADIPGGPSQGAAQVCSTDPATSVSATEADAGTALEARGASDGLLSVDTPRPAEVRKLKKAVRANLEKQGFKLTRTGSLAEVSDRKDRLRELHASAVEARREHAKPALAHLEDRFLDQLVAGARMDPALIKPRLVLVDDRRSFNGQLWRWCSLHWSIPVSSGYGRRLRFLVVDGGHGDAVMGLIGLGDPVFALGCRDDLIGWDRQQRAERLACVMDAFVLGAVPPYASLLGGKLMSLLAGSEEVQLAFSQRYGHRTTLITERDPNARLALVTTASALGRSSIYNRVYRPNGIKALVPAGYTGGTGDFHFSGEIYDQLADFARRYAANRPAHRHERWGRSGFRNRREVIQKGLDALGFDSRALRAHGVKRQVFLNPLAANTNEFLRGETDELDLFKDSSSASLADWWKRRWAIPRSKTDDRWLAATPEQWRLYR